LGWRSRKRPAKKPRTLRDHQQGDARSLAIAGVGKRNQFLESFGPTTVRETSDGPVER
jgi:hypothetical protein